MRLRKLQQRPEHGHRVVSELPDGHSSPQYRARSPEHGHASPQYRAARRESDYAVAIDLAESYAGDLRIVSAGCVPGPAATGGDLPVPVRLRMLGRCAGDLACQGLRAAVRRARWTGRGACATRACWMRRPVH